MRLTHAPSLLIAATLVTSFAPLAAADDVAATAESSEATPLRVSFHLGAGPSVIRPPADEAGSVTLLYGTGFSGWGYRGSARVGYAVSANLALLGELGVGHQTVSGYAEQGTLRREITFGMTAVEVPLGLQWQTPVSDMAARVYGGVAPHFMIAASATDEREGFESTEPAPEIRVAPQLGSFMGLGLVIPVGSVQVPIEVRGTYNLTYPNTTADRLDGGDADRPDEEGILEDPGAYLVDTDWTVLMSVGVELAPGQR